jgi:hypothetical protein
VGVRRDEAAAKLTDVHDEVSACLLNVTVDDDGI